MNTINYRMTKLNVSSININNIYDVSGSKGLNTQIYKIKHEN